MQYRLGDIYFMDGERPGSVIIHRNDGYYYHRHHDRDRPHSDYIDLRCVRRRRIANPCWGTAVMARDATSFLCTRPHNSHGPDFYFCEERQLRSHILQAVARRDPAPFSLIIRNIGMWGGFSMEARSRLTSARLRTTMRNVRLRNLPPIPNNIHELAQYLLDPNFRGVTMTLDGEDNIFAGVCGNYGNGTLSVVFMSNRLRLLLAGSSEIFSDGTFKKRPKKPVSSQLFVISTVWYHRRTGSKHIVTCIRVIMQSRTQEAYSALFTFLQFLMPGWYPQTIMCDHEAAQVNAWRQAFMLARIVTCLWHFAVDVFKYAKSLGLGPLMTANIEYNSLVRSCSALPLLPSEQVYEGLLALGFHARYNGLMNCNAVRSLFEYIHRQWIPLSATLSVCGSPDRTNNVSESVNAALAIEVPVNRPNVWSLVGAFTRLEDQTNIDLHGLRQGRNVRRPQTLTTLRNDAEISNLTEAFLGRHINIIDFLTSVSHRLQAPYAHVFN